MRRLLLRPSERCKQTRTLVRNFRKFIRTNSLTEHSLSYQLSSAATAMYAENLKTSTVCTYLRKIIAGLRQSLDKEEIAAGYAIAAELERAGLHEPVRRAPHLNLDEVTSWDYSGREEMRKVVELMCLLPVRLSCLREIKWRDIRLLPDFAEFDLKVGKNRKRKAHRIRARVPASNLSPWLRDRLAGKKKCSEAVTCITIHDFNRQLTELGGRHLTSYSIRNSVIRNAIKRNTDASGITDWDRTAQVTFHRSIKTLRAFYDH